MRPGGISKRSSSALRDDRELLAQMHLAGRSYAANMPTLAGRAGGRRAPQVAPFSPRRRPPCGHEVRFQAQHPLTRFARRDPCRSFSRQRAWDGARVGGVTILFCVHDVLLFDVAITVKDWCFSGAALDARRAQALLAAYDAVRPFTADEHAAAADAARRRAALLGIAAVDFHLPGAARSCTPKIPRTFSACSSSISLTRAARRDVADHADSQSRRRHGWQWLVTGPRAVPQGPAHW